MRGFLGNSLTTLQLNTRAFSRKVRSASPIIQALTTLASASHSCETRARALEPWRGTAWLSRTAISPSGNAGSLSGATECEAARWRSRGLAADARRLGAPLPPLTHSLSAVEL